MHDVVRAARVPTMTVATAALLTAGMLASLSGEPSWLVVWALALVAAVGMFLTAGTPHAPASLVASVAAMLASAALWGALDPGPSRVLAGVATVLYLALATSAVVGRPQKVSAK